jgi:putative ABC transport system permease protein
VGTPDTTTSDTTTPPDTTTTTQQITGMLKNYWMVAWRNLVRNKLFSFINIAGLAIGLSVCLLIYQYVQFEQSYDRFHKNAGQIYRVPITYPKSTSLSAGTATNHPAVGPAMKADFPEVEEFARLGRATLFGNAWSLSYEDGAGKVLTFNEEKIYIADASFMTLFSFPLVEGSVEHALKESGSIVVTETVARKYFGPGPALGKELKLNREGSFKVTGVLKDLPENSHLQFDILVSFAELGERWGYEVWGWPEFYNYILLAPGADPAALEAKLPAFVEKYVGDRMRQYNLISAFHLQPLASIHLTSRYGQEQDTNGSDRTVYFLTLLAVFILVIAWINYINLSTAKSLERSKEVGVRKVAGASKRQLVLQFFFDAFLVNLLAVLVAALIVPLSMPLLANVVGKDISSFMYAQGLWNDLSFWFIVPGAFILGVVLVGLYPAFVLSSFRPVQVLKGKFHKSPSGIVIRKSMVAFQYILSVFLIAGTVTIYRQLAYMEAIDPGYAKDQILVLKSPAVFDSTAKTRIDHFRNELKRLPAVTQVSASTDIPGSPITDRNSLRRHDQEQSESFVTSIQSVDLDFIKTFDLDLVAGRTFIEGEEMGRGDEVAETAEVRVMINEEAAKLLGYTKPEEALHQKISFSFGQGPHPAEVIGVLKNYHQLSLKDKFRPILYILPGWTNWRYISIRLDTRNLPQTLEAIEKTYLSSFQYNALEYFFLDDHFDKQYKADEQFGIIFTTFTLLAILVACLGLLGLSIFAITQRTKEIGIRKVLGASFSMILLLFSKDSVRLLIISYILAAPLVYFVADNWLNNFAFHITPGWEIFALPLVLLLLISVGTICVVCLRTALMNPATSLRHE